MLRALSGMIFTQSGEWFWVMCQFVALALSLFWLSSQVKYMRFANALQALAALEERWKSPLMLECRAMASGKNGSSSREIERPEGEVLYFFETLGLYLRRKVFDRELIWEKYSYFIGPYWQMFSPHIKDMRSSRNDLSFYDQFEYLNSEMKKCADRRKITNYEVGTVQDIQRFADGEIARLRPPRRTDHTRPSDDDEIL